MIDLDDFDWITKSDPSDFLESVEQLPDQFGYAQQVANEVEGLPDAAGLNGVAILGMGGSGISGDVADVILKDRLNVPVATVKNYVLPKWIGKDSLVFAASYSGNTEETLEAFEAALNREARIVVVSTGGNLGEKARQEGLPIIELPAGLQPRAAIGYLSVPILVACQRMGLVDGIREEMEETSSLLSRRSEEYGRKAPAGSNPAKQLAQRLSEHIPIVYGTDGIGGLAAYRWKCQMNEVAKLPSWSGTLPELDHNEIVGWGGFSEITKTSFALIVLRHAGDHARNRLRIKATVELIGDQIGLVEEFVASASSDLARFFDLIYFGDFVSTYVALLRGVDPAPVKVIEALKSQLSAQS